MLIQKIVFIFNKSSKPIGIIIPVEIQINHTGIYSGTGRGIISCLVSQFHLLGTETKARRILVDFSSLYSNS